jgi:hypothetical protein
VVLWVHCSLAVRQRLVNHLSTSSERLEQERANKPSDWRAPPVFSTRIVIYLFSSSASITRQSPRADQSRRSSSTEASMNSTGDFRPAPAAASRLPDVGAHWRPPTGTAPPVAGSSRTAELQDGRPHDLLRPSPALRTVTWTGSRPKCRTRPLHKLIRRLDPPIQLDITSPA